MTRFPIDFCKLSSDTVLDFTLGFFLIFLFIFYSWSTTFSFFCVCAPFFIVKKNKLGQLEVQGAYLLDLETPYCNLLSASLEIFSVNTLGLLQQWRQHLHYSRLVLILLQPCSFILFASPSQQHLFLEIRASNYLQ